MLYILWLQRLPQQFQAILQIQSDSPLDKLTEVADKIAEVVPPMMAITTTAALSELSAGEVNALV